MTNRKNRRFFGTIILCNLFLTLTVAFFSPMEVVLMNISEFYFPFRNIWWFQLLIALGAGIALSLPMFILPRRAGQIAASVTAGLGLAAYVQAMFLNGAMVTLTGYNMNITDSGKIVNLVIWGVIIVLTVLLVILLGRKRAGTVSRVMSGVTAALLAMQSVALVSLAVTTDLSEDVPDHYLSVDGEFELSSKNNVIEFVLDTTDGVFVRAMLDKYPDMYDVLSGWTYYPNATSKHSRTFPAITYMLTGDVCYYDKPVDDYVNEAYASASFLPGLYDAGTDIRVFTWDPGLVANDAEAYIANSSGFHYSRFENLNLPGLERQLMNIALYKSLPYRYKNYFRYTITQVNMKSFKRPELFTYDFDYYDSGFDADFTLYGEMTTTDKYQKAYRFYHLWGAHPGADWDDQLESFDYEVDYNDVDVRATSLRGSFRMLEDYIGAMKDLGIYDDAMIIVTADHGISDSGATNPEQDLLIRNSTACPVMMVKYPHSDLSKKLEIVESPVAHDDIFATVEQALGVPVSGTGSGRALNEIAVDEERDRYYYYAALRSDEEGEVASREYLIRGDAEDLSDWHLTGRWWDILYSPNCISGEVFDGGDPSAD